ncbi:MAG: bifunctional diaminohydroxyphosphoribosylaminopyrimidine deaminase/5-amino-6-(5-phosphoribosylamino)uracil reductase RibD, partial [Elusimicrobiota bacterium]|nr:bifunctional diaminohydroxyphosphoribosylaminopyrimidine deaminase/5-amino-6-(5-phosphoribosylamino)uracil reductase RibD [Elusimicrobiota bacterium]
MQKAVTLAGRGMNLTSPNPRVGCVIVKDGRVIGRGYHKKFGSLHAEAEALATADEPTGGATLFVTLEPCSHTGKTPPCSEAIIKAGIKRVVVGLKDPSPEIKGIQKLKENGVEVKVGVMAEECAEIIRDFIKIRNEKKPYVTLKSALSLDGKIATRTGASRWISSPASRDYTMKLRGMSDAVMIGAGTANNDNPALTYRLDEPEARDPLRIIVDGRLSVDSGLEIIREGTVLMAAEDADREKEKVLAAKGAKIIRLPAKEGSRIAPADILAELYKMD